LAKKKERGVLFPSGEEGEESLGERNGRDFFKSDLNSLPLEAKVVPDKFLEICWNWSKKGKCSFPHREEEKK